jgi:hypothetical protein
MAGPPRPPGPPDQRGPVLFLILLVMVALLTVAWALGRTPASRDGVPLGPAETERSTGAASVVTPR